MFAASTSLFSARDLIDFRELVHLVMDCIEQVSKRQLVYSQMVSFFFVNKFLMAPVTGGEVLAGSQLPWLPDVISKTERLCFVLSHIRILCLIGFSP